MVELLGYYDEDDRTHLPESQVSVADSILKSKQPVPVEDLQYNNGRLQSVQILDPRGKDYFPITLHTVDFKMEVYIDV